MKCKCLWFFLPVFLVFSSPGQANPQFISDIRLMDTLDTGNELQVLQARQLFDQFGLLSLDLINCRQDEDSNGETCNAFLEEFTGAYPEFRPLTAFWRARNHHYKDEAADALNAYEQFLSAYPELRWMGRYLFIDAYHDKADIQIRQDDLHAAVDTLEQLLQRLASYPELTGETALSRFKKARLLYILPDRRPEAMGLFQGLLAGNHLSSTQAAWLSVLYDTELWLQSRSPLFVLPQSLPEAVDALLNYAHSPGMLEQMAPDPEKLQPVGIPEGDLIPTSVTLEESVAMVRDSFLPLAADWNNIVRRGLDALVRICEADDIATTPLIPVTAFETSLQERRCQVHNFRLTRAGWSYQGLLVSNPVGLPDDETPISDGVFVSDIDDDEPPPEDASQSTHQTDQPRITYTRPVGACLTEGKDDLGCDWMSTLKHWPTKRYDYVKSQVTQSGSDRVAITGYNKGGLPYTYASVSIGNECHLTGDGIGCNEQMGYDRSKEVGKDNRRPVVNYKLRRPRDVRPLDAMGFKMPFAEKTGFSAGGLSLSRELSHLDFWGTAPSNMTLDSLYRATGYGLCNSASQVNSKDCAKQVCGDWGGGALYNSTGIYKDAYFNLLVSGVLGPIGTTIALINGNELPWFSTHYFTGTAEELFAIDFSRSGKNDQGTTVRACRGEPILASQEGFVSEVKNDVISGDGACNVDDFKNFLKHCVNMGVTDANYVEIEHFPLNRAMKCLATGSYSDCKATDYQTHYVHLMGKAYHARNTGPHTHWRTGQIIKHGGVTVEKGMYLRQGARLGLCDDTGISAIDHLHFKITSDVLGLPSKLTKAYYTQYDRENYTPAYKLSKGNAPFFMRNHTVPQFLEGELLLFPGQCVVSSNKEAVATRCHSNYDCPKGQFCSVAHGQLGNPYAYAWCTPYCLHSDQCPQWHLCDTTPGASFGQCARPDACQSVGDCPAGMRCGQDALYGPGSICIGECSLNRDCGDGASEAEQYRDAMNRTCETGSSSAASSYIYDVNTKLSGRTAHPQRAEVGSCRLLKSRPKAAYNECAVSSQCSQGSRCFLVTPAQWSNGKGQPLFDPAKFYTPWKAEYRSKELTTPGEDRGVCVTLPDRDGDWVFDSEDNCPDHANPQQEDSDGNGIGDVCDTTLSVEIGLQDHCSPPRDYFLGGTHYSFGNYSFSDHAGQSPVWGLPAEDPLKFHFEFDYLNAEPTPFLWLWFYACEGDCDLSDTGKHKLWFNYQMPDDISNWQQIPGGVRLETDITRRHFVCSDPTFCNPLPAAGKTYSVFVEFMPSHNKYTDKSHPNKKIKLGSYLIVDTAKTPWPDCPGGGIGGGVPPANPIVPP